MMPNDLHNTRAAYVRSLLAWHGKRQSALAGILGCSQQNASQKLAGKRQFTTDDLLAIAAALDVEPRYLLQVPTYDRGLLTCTKYQLGLVATPFANTGKGSQAVRHTPGTVRFPGRLRETRRMRMLVASPLVLPPRGGRIGNVA